MSFSSNFFACVYCGLLPVLYIYPLVPTMCPNEIKTHTKQENNITNKQNTCKNVLVMNSNKSMQNTQIQILTKQY